MEGINPLTLNGLAEGESCVRVKLYDETVKSEVNGDFVLPDYLPDIAKLLRVSAAPKPKGSYFSGDTLDWDGELSVLVIYMAEDGRIRGASFAQGYENTAALPPAENGEVFIQPRVGSVSARLTNPRRVAVKVPLSTRVILFGDQCAAPRLDGRRSIEDDINLERETAQVTSAAISKFTETGAHLSEDIELEGTLPQIGELIFCDVSIYMYECRMSPQDGKPVCRGDAVIDIVYESVGGDAVAVTKKLPVTCSAGGNDSRVGGGLEYECAASAYPTSITASAAPNSYGENRVVELDVEFDVSVMCAANKKLEITRDVYSTEFECACETGELPIMKLDRCFATNFSVNASEPRQKSETPPSVFCASASIADIGARYDAERGKVIVEGTADVVCSLRGQDGEQFEPVSFHTPLRCELDGGAVSGKPEFFLDARIIGAKGRLDASNVYADLEVALNIMMFDSEKVGTVSEVVLDRDKPAAARSSAPFLLCYPQPGETLWDIAKRYHTTRHALRELNNLGDALTPENKVLLIPRPKAKSVYSAVV